MAQPGGLCARLSRRVLPACVAGFAFMAPGFADQAVVPDDFESIGDALEAVAGTENATVIVEPGTYDEQIDLPDEVVLRGRETARTFLAGTGEGPIVTAAGTQGARLSNFTFIDVDAGAAVVVSGNSDLVIANNVFAVGGGATGISVETAVPQIVHNVFFENGTAIAIGANPLRIRNNAFVGNGASLTTSNQADIANNGFSANDDDQSFGSNPVTAAPRFVAPDELDFHLRAASPYIDAGIGADDALDDTEADIGAYGGEHAEGIPFPPGAPTVQSSTGASITLGWPDNPWYRLGGYRLHYDSDRSGPPYDGEDADQGSAPIDVGEVTEFTLEGLDAPDPPQAPELALPEVRNAALRLRWSEVPSAAGYIVSYGVSASDEQSVDVGDRTAYTLSGLQNGTTYRITVRAYARARYFLALTAYGDYGDEPQSAFSEEVSVRIGDPVDGPPSNEVSDFPEAIEGFPDLPDENGCFIATAAYGHYSAAEVQRLRAFRDRYLLTHAPGRAFVAWYYRHSPQWVQALDTHPWLKPLVRLVLFPAVVAADFALRPSAPPWGGWAVCLLALLLYRQRGPWQGAGT